MIPLLLLTVPGILLILAILFFAMLGKIKNKRNKEMTREEFFKNPKGNKVSDWYNTMPKEYSDFARYCADPREDDTIVSCFTNAVYTGILDTSYCPEYNKFWDDMILYKVKCRLVAPELPDYKNAKNKPIETKPEGKTIEQWLRELPDECSKAALVYASKENNLQMLINSLSQAIMYGFDWDNTKEGFDFWKKKCISARNKEEEIKPSEFTEKSKPESKTVEQWLRELPKEYVKPALEYAFRQKNLSKVARNINEALARGFDWESTKEGRLFWKSLYDKLRSKSSLPSIPEGPKEVAVKKEVIKEVKMEIPKATSTVEDKPVQKDNSVNSLINNFLKSVENA